MKINERDFLFAFSYQRTLHRNLSYLTQFDMSQSHHPNSLPVCSKICSAMNLLIFSSHRMRSYNHPNNHRHNNSHR